MVSSHGSLRREVKDGMSNGEAEPLRVAVRIVRVVAVNGVGLVERVARRAKSWRLSATHSLQSFIAPTVFQALGNRESRDSNGWSAGPQTSRQEDVPR